MRRFLSVAALLLVGLVSLISAAEIKQTPAKPLDWQPVIGFSLPGYKAYYDRNSIVRDTTAEYDYGAGSILVTSDKEVPYKGSDGKITASRAMVRYHIVDCKHMVTTPLTDFFFSVPMPTRSDLPIGGTEYTKPQLTSITKDSSLYTLLCPNYI